eukprot:TRINITY_DN43863_c0_g1_i1.p2 TRINITY_DN43863_c0_g1~~TRINITY_DN43863_c0_g1_i1.p2  ORF type:complete len:151 (+),score=21.38 TRINITY_DN43863_c0_g1_i1:621-1073(+)
MAGPAKSCSAKSYAFITWTTMVPDILTSGQAVLEVVIVDVQVDELVTVAVSLVLVRVCDVNVVLIVVLLAVVVVFRSGVVVLVVLVTLIVFVRVALVALKVLVKVVLAVVEALIVFAVLSVTCALAMQRRSTQRPIKHLRRAGSQQTMAL